MRIMPAASAQQQLLEKQQAAIQKKQDWQQGADTRPAAWGRKDALPKAANAGASMSLRDVLRGMLPGGIGGLDNVGGPGTTGSPKTDEAVQRQLGEIDIKMKTGQPLTEDEMALLEKHNPEAFRQAKQMKIEREQYRKELENCRSKEDVEKLNQRQLSKFSGQLQAVIQSNLSRGEKAKQAEMIAMRMLNTEREFERFAATDRYQSLPDQREENRADGKNRSQGQKATEEVKEPAEPQEMELDGIGNGAEPSAPAQPQTPGDGTATTPASAESAVSSASSRPAAAPSPAPAAIAGHAAARRFSTKA